MSNGTIVTHKIIEIIDADSPADIQFRTQGEANDTPDNIPVRTGNVIGRADFSIPYLGYVSNFVQTTPGSYISICMVALLIIFIFLPDIIRDNKEACSDDINAKEDRGEEK